MKKAFALTLATILALSLLTACGGGNNNTSSGGNSNTSTPSASDGSGNNNTPANTPGNKKSGGVTTLPEITVNIGDVIFDNEYVKLVYDRVDLENQLWSMKIMCTAVRKSEEQNIYIFHGENPLVINGTSKEYYDYSYAVLTKGNPDECSINIDLKTLEQKTGFTLDDIKTVQATFSVEYAKSQKLFEGVVVFNIELP